MRRLTAPAFLLLLSAACSSPAPSFSLENARAHVRMLADTIGSRPAGSDANRRAREYVVDRLREYGFTVRVQEADAERGGVTARVANVIATRPGRRAEAIALVAHYDSVPDGPGAADDGLGVAVCLEAGRVLAARPHPNYALAVVLTDAEEAGLMGASALVKDPIAGWIRAVLNFEAVGSGGPNLLFETTPGSRPLLDAWARSPNPSGASYMADVYEALPNDTDFSVLKRRRVAGINFGIVGDSYSYHTDRDTTSRLDPGVLRQVGEGAVAIVTAVDAGNELASADVAARIQFMDVFGRWAIVYGPGSAAILVAAALLAALFGWVTVLPVARQAVSIRTILLTAAWAVAGTIVVFAAMLGAEWLLRATRESFQPWYAHPGRFFAYLVLAGIVAALALVRVARRLRVGLHGSAEPAVLWAIIVPFWTALVVAVQIVAPSGSAVVALPVLVTGAALVLLPVRRPAAMRLASAIAVASAVASCGMYPIVLLRFMVAALGRSAVVTPLSLYPALVLALGLTVVPSLVALAAAIEWRWPGRNRRGDRFFVVELAAAARLLLVALLVFAAAWCWFAPAYTDDRPLRASVCYVNDATTGRARWQIASTEPGAHVGVTAPLAGGWQSGAPPATFGVPINMPLGPFQMHGIAARIEPAPVTATGSLGHDADGAFIEVRAVPTEPALTVAMTLPAAIVPERTNLTGRQQEGSGFIARYIAVPPEGVTLRARITADDARQVESGGPGARATVLVVQNGLPGATWPKLPGWLTARHIAWRARSYFLIPVALAPGRP